MQSPPHKDFGASLKNYFDNKTLSDAVIRCGGRDFAVHSLILYCHSEYFRKQLNGPWKESSDRVIDITDFDPTIVEAMTRFLYCFDYESPVDTSAMIFHAKVYQIADKYGIEDLKKYSVCKYRASIDADWEMEDFPAAISLAYTTTPAADRGLRDSAVDVAFKRIGALMSRESFCETLSDNTDLTADMIRLMHGKLERVREYKCADCPDRCCVFLFGNPKSPEDNPYYCPSCKSYSIKGTNNESW